MRAITIGKSEQLEIKGEFTGVVGMLVPVEPTIVIDVQYEELEIVGPESVQRLRIPVAIAREMATELQAWVDQYDRQQQRRADMERLGKWNALVGVQ